MPFFLAEHERGLPRDHRAPGPFNLALKGRQVELSHRAPRLEFGLQLPVHRVELARRNPVLADETTLDRGQLPGIPIEDLEAQALQARQERGALFQHWAPGLALDPRLERQHFFRIRDHTRRRDFPPSDGRNAKGKCW
jgi:hypothetical protein